LKIEVKEEIGLKVVEVVEFKHFFEPNRDLRSDVYSIVFEVRQKTLI